MAEASNTVIPHLEKGKKIVEGIFSILYLITCGTNSEFSYGFCVQ